MWITHQPSFVGFDRFKQFPEHLRAGYHGRVFILPSRFKCLETRRLNYTPSQTFTRRLGKNTTFGDHPRLLGCSSTHTELSFLGFDICKARQAKHLRCSNVGFHLIVEEAGMFSNSPRKACCWRTYGRVVRNTGWLVAVKMNWVSCWRLWETVAVHGNLPAI